jgi:hypothetical protein
MVGAGEKSRNKGGEGKETPRGISKEGATLAAAPMDANGQEGHIQCWDMEALSEANVMIVKADGNCTTPIDRSVLVSSHPNKAINQASQ